MWASKTVKAENCHIIALAIVRNTNLRSILDNGLRFMHCSAALPPNPCVVNV